jgi:hypothetical protein
MKRIPVLSCEDEPDRTSFTKEPRGVVPPTPLPAFCRWGVLPPHPKIFLRGDPTQPHGQYATEIYAEIPIILIIFRHELDANSRKMNYTTNPRYPGLVGGLPTVWHPCPPPIYPPNS